MSPVGTSSQEPPGTATDLAAVEEAHHDERVCQLRGGGTSVVLGLAADSMPSVLHWGPDLGDLDGPQLAAMARALRPDPGNSRMYTQIGVTLLPQHATGWLGRPGLAGSRRGRAWSTQFDTVTHVVEPGGSGEWPEGPAGATRLRSTGADGPASLQVDVELELHPSGLLRIRGHVHNHGSDDYDVVSLEPALPVPPDADQLLDMAGHHTLERVPQRRPFDVGAWVREARGARPGHDSATLLCAGRSGFGFRSGRVWGVHLAYSGNQVLCAERTYNGWRLLRGGELLEPGEVILAPGESYTSPWLTASWGDGLDELSHRFHDYLRSRPTHPTTPRPVLLNTWEAVYFHHDLVRLLELADRAAQVGAERFVLDDGWFTGRRDDSVGLGDWQVDAQVWPRGLHPLVDRVRELGMQFGLWFEPEMVNLDSNLARAHPEWLFDAGHGPGLASRQQHGLDLGHPGAFRHILDLMSGIIAEYHVDYVKWDHNRPLVDAGHQPQGTPGVHSQTMALYELLGELKRRHPGLEIESCAGGGGRIDLGILDHTDRVWVSDCIDPHDRQDIQRWTSLLLPPELTGTHIGSATSHTTGRTHSLDFRAGTALWGHLGVEWDLTTVDTGELDALRRWISYHKEVRALLHRGRTVHADLSDSALRVEGVVDANQEDALYQIASLARSLSWPPGRVPLPGLDPERSYDVFLQAPVRRRPDLTQPPEWMRTGVRLPGRLLAETGVEAPRLHPDQLVLVRATAAERTSPAGEVREGL